MTHWVEGSDSAIEAVKRTNEAEAEGRRSSLSHGRGPRSTRSSTACPGTRAGQARSDGWNPRTGSRKAPEVSQRFTVLLYDVHGDQLREADFVLKREAALGVHGATSEDYGHDLEVRLEDLHGLI